MTVEKIAALQQLKELQDAHADILKCYNKLTGMSLTEVTTLWRECATQEELHQRLVFLCT